LDHRHGDVLHLYQVFSSHYSLSSDVSETELNIARSPLALICCGFLVNKLFSESTTSRTTSP